jgi:nucleotide-binding universal stress UspA family protein
LVLELVEAAVGAVISMKTILIPVETHDAMRSTLQTAMLLARRFDSYVEGFALRFRVNEFIAVDMAGAIPLESLREENQEEAKRARLLFDGFMRENGIPQADRTAPTLSFNWFNDAPEGENFVGSYGRVFDVIVMSRPDANTIGVHNKALESGLFESGRPLLIAPPSAPRQIATNILIAWNCSTEQARTTALAMPLLQKAERVTVLTVVGGSNVPGPSAEQAIQYLQRNGIAAVPMSVDLNDRTTGEAILATAQSLNCDLLVKGAYTQSRLRQMIFGGATRHILSHASLPVLMAN